MGIGVIGVDPGNHGALAFHDGHTLLVNDVPLLTVVKSGKARKTIDPHTLSDIIRAFSSYGADISYIEMVGGMPHDGAVQAFAFGRAYGTIIGTLAALGISHVEVPTARWRNAVGVKKTESGDKAPCFARASEIFPEHTYLWEERRGNGDEKIRSGRAEAALIAYYGYSQCRHSTK